MSEFVFNNLINKSGSLLTWDWL